MSILPTPTGHLPQNSALEQEEPMSITQGSASLCREQVEQNKHDPGWLPAFTGFGDSGGEMELGSVSNLAALGRAVTSRDGSMPVSFSLPRLLSP